MSGGTIGNIDGSRTVTRVDTVVADEVILQRGISQVDSILQLGHRIHQVAVNINTGRIAGMNSGEVQRVGRGDLLDVVVGDNTVGVAQTYTSVARSYIAIIHHQVIPLVVGTHIIDTGIATVHRTVAESD